MSKRPGNIGHKQFKFTKKAKYEDNVADDDIWGEDLNEDDVEECILQATQASQKSLPSTSQNPNNTTWLPTYSDFKVPRINNLCTSTQNNHSFPKQNTYLSKNLVKNNSGINNFSDLHSQNTVIIQQSSGKDVSKYLLEQIDLIKKENEKLKDQCLTKDGEVSILRNQLKQTQLVVDTVRAEKVKITEKHHQEWTEKVCDLNKKLNTAKLETEFKDLEIVNLKERCRTLESVKVKIIESSNHGSRPNSSFSKNFSTNFKSGINDSCQTENIYNQTLLPFAYKSYPLKSEISEDIFLKSNQEMSFIDVKRSQSVNRSSLPILQYDESLCNLIEKSAKLRISPTVMNNKQPLTIEFVYSELSYLMKLSDVQLNSDDVRFSVNKIFFVAEELLLSTLDVVHTISEGMEYEDLNSLDDLYLNRNESNDENCINVNIYSPREICCDEKSIELRRILAVLSAIARHNRYISDHIIQKTKLIVEDDDFVRENFKYFKKINELQEKCNIQSGTSKQNISKEPIDFLGLMYDLVKTIGEIRRSHLFDGLLLTISKLLINVTENTKDSLNERKYIIVNIFKEIVFLRPSLLVLSSVLTFFTNVSNNEEIPSLFCHSCKASAMKTDNKNSLLYFTKDSCILQIFGILLVRLLNKQNKIFSKHLDILDNILCFIHNGLSIESHWIFLAEKTECLCFVKIVNVFLKSLQLCLEQFVEGEKDNDLNLVKYFKTTVNNSLLLLFILSFRKQEVICRSPHIIKQYHDIIRLFGQLEPELDFKSIHKTAYEDMYTFYYEHQTTECELSKENEETLKNISTICFSSFKMFD